MNRSDIDIVHDEKMGSDEGDTKPPPSRLLPEELKQSTSDAKMDESEKSNTSDETTPVKKKRKSPAVPWKKPKDMPRRPLSAYNLYFKTRREDFMRSINAGPQSEDASPVSVRSGKSRKHEKTCGMGFANLARTIASEWKALSQDKRQPFEEIAAVEKQKYDKNVADWRIKQKEKEIGTESAIDKRKIAPYQASPAQYSVSSNQSIASITGAAGGGATGGGGAGASASDQYPYDWFDVSPHNNMADSFNNSGNIPSIIDTSASMDESSRTFDGSQNTHGSSYRSLDTFQMMELSERQPNQQGQFFLFNSPHQHQQRAGRWIPEISHGAAINVPNVHPKPQTTQTNTGMEPHEFARALPNTDHFSQTRMMYQYPTHEYMPIQNPRGNRQEQSIDQHSMTSSVFEPLPFSNQGVPLPSPIMSTLRQSAPNQSISGLSRSPYLLRGESLHSSMQRQFNSGNVRGFSLPSAPPLYEAQPLGRTTVQQQNIPTGNSQANYVHQPMGSAPQLPSPLNTIHSSGLLSQQDPTSQQTHQLQQQSPITQQTYHQQQSEQQNGAHDEKLDDDSIDYITGFRFP